MKITLATAFFFCALVAFVKANNFAGLEDETEGLEDELFELEDSKIEDPPMGPPNPQHNLEYALEALLDCFLNKNKGKMDKKCIRKFKENLGANIPRREKNRLVKCAVRSFENCKQKSKHHEHMDCMLQFKGCAENGEEGSGNWLR